MAAPFWDRRDAGRRLAGALSAYAGDSSILVLGLPRGGVPVAFEVARALDAALDVFVVRKIGAPANEELALGAVASGGVRVFNEDVIGDLRLRPEAVETIVRDVERQVAAREAVYRGHYPALDPRDRTVLLIDDGLATGATMRAAVTAVRRREPRRLIVGVPVAAAAICRAFEHDAAVDHFVCLLCPAQFRAVGLWYQDFSQTPDGEVTWLLEEARRSRRSEYGSNAGPAASEPTGPGGPAGNVG